MLKMSDRQPDKYPWDCDNYRYKGPRQLDNIYRSRWGKNVIRVYVKNSRREGTEIGDAIVCEKPLFERNPTNATVYLGKIWEPCITLHYFNFFSLNESGYDSVYYGCKYYVYSIEQVYMDNYDADSNTSSKEEKKEEYQVLRTEIETLKTELADTREVLKQTKQKLDEANDARSRELICTVCLEGPLNYLSTNCGHLFACEDCVKSCNSCPICRKPFKDTELIRIFIP